MVARDSAFDAILDQSLEVRRWFLHRGFLVIWKMGESSIEKSWSMLSGGEAQRALASRARFLPLDEWCTSALYLATKILDEQSMEAFAKASGMMDVSCH